MHHVMKVHELHTRRCATGHLEARLPRGPEGEGVRVLLTDLQSHSDTGTGTVSITSRCKSAHAWLSDVEQVRYA